MAEFRCISCGALKESESSCSCPVCGYKMFQTPYDRKSILISEIESFIARLEVKSVLREDLVFVGKDEDDSRFPSYDKILKYVSSKDRTEDFLSNLLETAEQLKLHFTDEFSKTYPVSFDNLDGIIAQYDELLYAAARFLIPGVSVKLPRVEWDEVSLLYSETQNKYLWFSASELLELIEKLAQKIVKFIKINNLYGNNHKYFPEKRAEEFNDNTDFKDELEKAILTTEKILRKKYVVDIMDDGSDELKEMLTCLWHGIELIMSAPLFIKHYNYLTEAGGINEKALLSRTSSFLAERYAGFDDELHLGELLREKTETEVFEIYKGLIGVDKYGFLVPVGSTLINIGESEKKLNELIGLEGVKESIQKIKAYALSNKDSEDLNIHMCFLGNPGSGKTEVARYIAGILYENSILPSPKIVEVDRSGLVSQYLGATAEKTRRVIASAMGGVLFIDEAYALGNNSDRDITDYGKEAIDTLVKAMEDYRGKFCVILAGYKNEMLKMLSTNPGFKSRIQFTLDFPNYSRAELKSITELMLKNRHYTMSDTALERVLDITDIKRKDANFANAREIRNMLDQVIMCQNLRTVGSEDKELGLVDVNKYIQDSKIELPTTGTEKTILSGEEELEQLIGLSSVKRMIRKIKAYAKKNVGSYGFNLHMCFQGNPGTGKTEVARILSRILYSAGVLPEAKLVETDSTGLLGRFVGETGPKTQRKIQEAMGGVLFIDEAYALCAGSTVSGASRNYGDEAIAVLLKEMEDHRGQFCVVLAGYKNEMEKMLNMNPGFKSRIQFSIDFPDYSREELGQIATSFLTAKKYEIADDALDRLLDVAEYYRQRPNFANARTIRSIVDQVILNQNLRAEDSDGDYRIILSDVEDYITDEGIDFSSSATTRRIGF